MKKKLLSVWILILLLGISDTYGQTRTISGLILSGEDYLPLPGVNVTLKGTSQGITSDLDGRFSLQVSNNDVVVFSYVGFLKQEIILGTQTSLEVIMLPDSKMLGEVVVVGYGSETRGDLTGNIASIKGDEIANIPVPNFTEALQGRLAGVFVESASGKVGEGVKVRIRGTSSISSGSDPLYVIDGIPVTATGSLGYSNPLSDINFNDIESFEVLKDASAAAIYGARASNGVVLIATRSGAEGKTKFNFGFQRGLSSPTRLMEWMNAADYVELIRESAINADLIGGTNSTDPDKYPDSWLNFVEDRMTVASGHGDWRSLNIDTDWQRHAFNEDAGTTNLNFSASGGNDKTQFYLSGAYDEQDGILIRNNLTRISTRLNLDHQVSDQFSLGINFGLSRTANNRLSDDFQFNNPLQLTALAPITPVRDPNGQLYDRPVTEYYNNLIDSENASWKLLGFRNLTNLYGEFKFNHTLRFRSELGADILNQNEERFFGSRTNSGLSTNGYGSSKWVRIFNYNTNNYFTYENVFDEKHDLNVVAGMSFQLSERDYTFVEGQEFPLDALKTLASAADIVGGESQFENFSFLSYFARANYKLNNKYLFTASGRLDGSSRFGKENKYGFFPAASAGWMISQEDFLIENTTLSLLKLRTSYGLTGNAEIGNYDHLGLFGTGAYGQFSGLVPDQIPNPDLRWEKTAQFDIGIEFGLFEDRITGELDYYHKNTFDLLLDVPVPGTTGFLVQTQNVGDMKNYGFEVVLNSSNIVKKNFTWTVSLNLARNFNEVTALAEGQTTIPSGASSFLNAITLGEPVGAFYGVAYAGVDPNNGDAIFYSNEERTETTNNFNEAARMILGSPHPKLFGGLTNNFTFENFDASFLFQGVYGNDIFLVGGSYFAANGNWFDNGTKKQMGRWQKPGDVTDIPQARFGTGNGTQPSSRYLSDGSYLRLKTLTVGYSLPSEILDRLKVTSLRVYFIGQNLLTFTNYAGWDPEVNADGLSSFYMANDFYSAPQAKTYSLGINVGF
jgi:TonB-linked SusC/RagA family outer membrane protein